MAKIIPKTRTLSLPKLLMFGAGLSLISAISISKVEARNGRRIHYSTSSSSNKPKEDTKVSGRILDENGEAAVGVNVVIKGTTTGTTTNAQGRFSITVPDLQTVLLVSLIGYTTEEINVSTLSTTGSLSNVSISLMPDIATLSDVVIVGYGSQNKRDATGAISTVKAKDLNTTNAISVDNLLQGKAAGVQILQRSAQPGGGLSIAVRGALSPRGSNEPLYVIDGVPLTTTGAGNSGKTGAGGQNNIEGADRSPLASINPNDIVSIEILKDASAAAIYGSAAAGGVVLINTKRGATGKPTISVSSSYATQVITKQIETLGSQEFMNSSNAAQRERFLFDNGFAPYTSRLAPTSGWAINYTDAQIAAGATTYDHNKAIFRTGLISDNNVSVSGGTETTKYFVSANYLNQKSVMKTTDFERFSGRINLDQTINKWFKISLTTLYSQIGASNPSIGGDRTEINEARQTQAAIFFTPRLPLENPDGSLTTNDVPDAPNPAAWLYIKDRTLSKRLFVAPNLQFKINSNLSLNAVIGYDNTSATRENFSPTKSKLPIQAELNYAGFSNNVNTNVSAETFLTYNKQLSENHRITAVAGVGYYKASGTQFGLSVFNLPTDAVENFNLALAPQSDLNSYYSDKFARTKMSQFGRVNYVFKEKYFLAVTARNDGSSAFPSQNKWGFFPAVSAAWSIADEIFLKNVSSVNNLKLRASYGTTGNESFLTNNIFYVDRYAAAFGTSYYIGGQQNTGVIQTQLGNRDLRWETNISTNIGLDFGFFNNRLSGSFDVFQRTAKDLLDFGRLPFNSPITIIAQNVGSTQSRGFDLSLNGTLINKNDFNWNINMNLSHSVVRWAERNPYVALDPWVGENDRVFQIYGWQTDGIFRSAQEVQDYKSADGVVLQPQSFAGNVRYIDQNQDGKLDQLDVVKLGDPTPNFNFGLGTSASFKGFDLSVQTYGFLGSMLAEGWQNFGSLYRLSQRTNQHISVRDIWSSTNPTGDRPGGVATSVTDANNPTRTTDYFLDKINFLRLKNVSLGYTLPKTFLQKKNIANSVRVFVDFQNLAIWTNYIGLDPEMELNSASPFPIPRTTTAGINITF